MRPGHGEQLIAEGDPEVAEEHDALVEAFRRQLDLGMWAAVPLTTETGRREAEMVASFDQVPLSTDRIIFFPRAAGGAPSAEEAARAAGEAGDDASAAGGAA